MYPTKTSTYFHRQHRQHRQEEQEEEKLVDFNQPLITFRETVLQPDLYGIFEVDTDIRENSDMQYTGQYY